MFQKDSHWKTQSIFKEFEAQRKRVFLLIAKKGFNPFDSDTEAQVSFHSEFNLSCHFSFFFTQDKTFQHWAEEEWNPESHTPLAEWLVDDRTQEQQERFHSLGNVVVPRQASLGAFTLGKILKCA